MNEKPPCLGLDFESELHRWDTAEWDDKDLPEEGDYMKCQNCGVFRRLVDQGDMSIY